ncbi:glycosyl hydrolase 115 family protein [Autumnicola musiva]|uniref:Glycosyl hydrolase 115 family protein n=1 Tax=Autumnicola musiva TaxID=3075589 RepID=A0ABU3D4Q5_9FLAO|nr:glycosyl hydrolase 115 family protein [Zunongwangia sp. F117]MDT0676512.1 glycosyl hydrolase 115 family protein [Zunongwangia sp. F117]
MRYLLLILLLPHIVSSQIHFDTSRDNNGNFPIISDKGNAAIYYDTSENILIKKSVNFLASDIEKVTNQKPKVLTNISPDNKNVIIVATLGKNEFINKLEKQNKLDLTPLENKWEKFILKTIENPGSGIEKALVIVGSDRRGAAYGVFSLSEKMGVSPWHYWADVPTEKSKSLSLQNVNFISKSPSVKYRGIFLNDESPSLRNWAKEKFGGFNHEFYEKVYELLLRKKANFLWPAMWLPTVFAEDDPSNPKVADEYGIVISTSHHEPMMRAHDEWGRYGGGAWNYETNKKKLQKFWKGGIERMEDYESIVTVGMRGDGDEAMSEGAAVELLQEVIEDQRNIISEVTQKPAEETPQVWAIYKEVQEYYDKGMRVDDDITILFSDDNWGNIRILPKKEDRGYEGGYGMYYHFDYVGAPVSYRWQNVTQIERVWEQMKLSYEWGVDELWLANVGDIKPMELPISFYLDMAWNVDSFNAADLPEYYVDWAAKQFGSKHAADIAEILSLYTKYNARRTHEMLTPSTYSVSNYREADRVLKGFRQLIEKSLVIMQNLPGEYEDAYQQLVHAPLEMSANVNEMYIATAKNQYYAELGAKVANKYADSVKIFFEKDAKLTERFHEEIADGKWNHMMSQTHLGYTSWNHPPANKMPSISYIQVRDTATLGYNIEHGTEPAWHGFSVEGDGLYSESFPTFDPINDQKYFIEIFNRGDRDLSFEIKAKDPWIKLSSTKGTIQYTEKIDVSINWDTVPDGETMGEIEISSKGQKYSVEVPLRTELPKASGYVENNGIVSIEAKHFKKQQRGKNVSWEVIPNLGRTGSSVAITPMDAERQKPDESTAILKYDFTIYDDSDLHIETYLSPTQNYQKNEGLKFAIAIDDEEPQIININEGEIKPDWEYADWWSKSVADHIKKSISKHSNIKSGSHTLKVWALDPGVVIQKFVIRTGEERNSYLGPPESNKVD